MRFRTPRWSPSFPSFLFFPLVRIVSSSLRKQFIWLFVFRLAVPRGLFQLLPAVLISRNPSRTLHPPPLFFLSPCRSAVAVTFNSDLCTRRNCFPICRTYGHVSSAARILPPFDPPFGLSSSSFLPSQIFHLCPYCALAIRRAEFPRIRRVTR